MSRKVDILDVNRPAPAMPSACQSGGCGGSEPQPVFPSFGDVRVNGVEIDPEEIAREIQYHPAPDAETAWREAARALAIRELLLQEARRTVIDSDAEMDEEVAIQQLLEIAVEPDAPTEAECLRYYDANQHRFRTPDLFEAAHILITPEGNDDAAWREAETLARTIAEQLVPDPAAFAAMARAHSACASAQQDGSLGQIRHGEVVPEIQQAIEALADGETAATPVRSRHGWHVIRRHKRLAGQTLPFEAVQPKIVDMLEARSWTTGSMRFVSDLATRSEVVGIAISADA